MFVGLQDFDINIFLNINDQDVYIYYSDFESIPTLVNFIPLGSFDDEGKLRLTALKMSDRISTGLEFLHRDFYAEYTSTERKTLIRVDRFLKEFNNIPEVMEFFDPYLSLCETDTPPSWCTSCAGDPRPEYYNSDYSTCSIAVPMEEFIKIDPTTGEEDFSDLYYIILLYFNGIYRTSAQNVQDFGTYDLLTDINFDINNYSMIINIKEFFTKQFIYFLKCLPGSIPFSSDYGTDIKLVVQTKNFVVRQLEAEAEIQFFITTFNLYYGSLVKLKDINLVSRESDVGADEWIIEVFAEVQQERLIYRLEI